MEALKIIIGCLAFVVVVALMAILAAKINGIDLDADPADMDDRSRALYIALLPLWKIASWILRIFKR